MSGENYSCQFHQVIRDTNRKIISDLDVIRVSFGPDPHSTHSIYICRECWEKLKDSMQKAYFI